MATLPDLPRLLDDARRLARRHAPDPRAPAPVPAHEPDGRADPFAVRGDGSGWYYAEIDGRCFIWRERGRRDAFDEPVMMRTPCNRPRPPGRAR